MVTPRGLDPLAQPDQRQQPAAPGTGAVRGHQPFSHPHPGKNINWTFSVKNIEGELHLGGNKGIQVNGDPASGL